MNGLKAKTVVSWIVPVAVYVFPEDSPGVKAKSIYLLLIMNDIFYHNFIDL